MIAEEFWNLFLREPYWGQRILSDHKWRKMLQGLHQLTITIEMCDMVMRSWSSGSSKVVTYCWLVPWIHMRAVNHFLKSIRNENVNIPTQSISSATHRPQKHIVSSTPALNLNIVPVCAQPILTFITIMEIPSPPEWEIKLHHLSSKLSLCTASWVVLML